MTPPDSAHRDRRRRLERELSDLPAPPPPVDLLEAIRREVPADPMTGSAASGPASRPWHRNPLVRLAASIAFAAVGATVALRLGDRRPGGPVEGPPGVTAEAAPLAVPTEPLGLERLSAALLDRRPTRGVVVPEEKRDESSPPGARATPGDQQAAPASRAPGPSLRPYAGRVVDSDDAEAGASEPARSAAEGKIEVLVEPPLVGQLSIPASDRIEWPGKVKKVPAPRRVDLAPRPAPPSTGGTAEPNDAPVGDMFFRHSGVNPFVDTSEDARSTFALEVDTGSWSLARAYLERGALPPPEAIRVEEIVNAQRYDDPAPRRGELTLVAEGAPSPFAPAGDYRLLRFAVKGRELDSVARRPAALTFVVDVSGSMRRENRLGLVKQALGLLLDELRYEDRVALVVYGTRGRIVLEPTGDHERIRRAIESLQPEGSTNAEEGLRLGYELADRAYREGWNNRVLLCSDGVANVGATGPESILERIGREARRGIGLTTVGFGMGNYNDALMEQLADQGDGSYHYVDSLEDAAHIFRENLSGTLETIARDAKVQVEFDRATVERWRLLGYENRDVADRDFRNDRLDAGEIGAGHSATALYEVRLAPRAGRGDSLATLRLRWQSLASGRVEEASLVLRVGDLDRSFERASPNLRRAAVAAELAELLKRSFYAREGSWSLLRDQALRLADEGRDQGDRDLERVVESASALDGPAGRWRDDDR